MASGADMLAAELDSVLGTAWDEALEPYRNGGDTRRGAAGSAAESVADDIQSGVGSRRLQSGRGARIFSAPGTADTSTGSGQAYSPSA